MSTHQQTALASLIKRALADDPLPVAVEADAMQAAGLVVPSIEFADWLTAHGLRLCRQRLGQVTLAFAAKAPDPR